jgi:hypothetical protein
MRNLKYRRGRRLRKLRHRIQLHSGSGLWGIIVVIDSNIFTKCREIWPSWSYRGSEGEKKHAESGPNTPAIDALDPQSVLFSQGSAITIRLPRLCLTASSHSFDMHEILAVGNCYSYSLPRTALFCYFGRSCGWPLEMKVISCSTAFPFLSPIFGKIPSPPTESQSRGNQLQLPGKAKTQ